MSRSIVGTVTQAIEQGFTDQAVQAIAAVLAGHEKWAALGQREQSVRPGALAQEPLRVAQGDGVADRERFEPTLLIGRQAAQYFAFDIGPEQRTAAHPKLPRRAT